MNAANALSSPNSSPYSRWRMLIVTPDYASLRKIQRLFVKRFERIEFEMDGPTARDRIKDIFAPSFKMVIVDKKTVSNKEASHWKTTFENLSKQPVLLLMADNADSGPARLAASMGCVGIINIQSPAQKIARQMLVSTGHIAPEPDEILFDPSEFSNHASDMFSNERMQNATASIGQFVLPKCPDIVHDIKATLGQPIAAFIPILEKTSEHPLLGKALSRASNMVFRYKDIKRVQLAAETIGSDAVRELLLIAALQETFSNEKHAISGFELKLWRMSIASGKVFESLLRHYPEVGKVIPARDALISGIVANCGMLILFKKFADYLELVDYGFQWDIIGSDQCAWENRRYGIDNTLLSHQIAKNWRMKAELRNAIQHQHNPTPPAMTPVSAQLREMLIICSALSSKYLYADPSQMAISSKLHKIGDHTRLSYHDAKAIEADIDNQTQALFAVF